ncbi:MAG: LPS export ABC transporter periplasmic protein LptC [Conchiformibius sp.]|nr:LPS export ABC transporter periplasmic protein LptC [Conchiformibius sp.]
MINVRNWLFPMGLALILGGLSAWLERISEIRTENVRPDPAKPQYEIQGMSGKRFDDDGLLQESLNAQRAWQLPEQKDIYLSQADLEQFAHGQPQYRVQSGTARYHTEQRTVHFQDGVTLNKTADADRPAAEVQTSSLTVDTVAQTAHTDDAVTFRYGQSHGSANGMYYNHKTGKLDLPAQVKALIYDPKQPQQ